VGRNSTESERNGMIQPYNGELPDWTLLEEAVKEASLPPAVVGEFMWMGEWKEGQHSYKHIDTRKYVVLTGKASGWRQVLEARRA
jgi:hypothetical protein